MPSCCRTTRVAVLLFLAGVLTGCVAPPATRPVHQDQRTIVELRVDPRAGSGHSHPVTLAQEQMIRILSGLRVRSDRYAVHRLFAGEAEERRAFTPEEIWALAAPLVKALAMAKPGELVTYYRRVSDQTTGLAFTTGGLFRRGEDLYLILANYRQSPSDAMALGNPAYEIDPVDDPLLPMRRAGYTVSFVPREAEVHPVASAWSWSYVDPGKIVVINPSLVQRQPAPQLGDTTPPAPPR